MKILRDSSIYLIGEIVAKGIPFLLLPYFTRKLGTEGFGVLSYYQALFYFLVLFVGFSQAGAISRYYYFYGKKSINIAIKSGYALTCGITLLFIALFAALGSKIMIYVTIAAAFQALIDVQLSLRQCQKKASSYITLQIFYSFANVFITLLLLEFTIENLVESRMFAMLLAGLCTFSLAYWLRERNRKLNLSKYFYRYKLSMKYLFIFGLPLSLHTFSSLVRGQLDRIIIYEYFTESELGIYSAGFQIASILAILLMSINRALVPYYYGGLKNGDINSSMLFRWFILSFFFIPIPALIAWLTPMPIYTFILGSGYEDSKYYVTMFLMAISAHLPYYILINYLFYYGKNYTIALASTISTLLYVTLLLLLSQYGIRLLPYASIFSELLIIIIIYLACTKTALENSPPLKNNTCK